MTTANPLQRLLTSIKNLLGKSAPVIPKNILHFWHDKRTIPDLLQNAMRVTANNNPDYRVIFTDDDSIRQLIQQRHSPELLALYNLTRIPASRSDIARLVMLYEYGGVYLDVSMEIHGSLNKLYDRETELALVRRDDIPKYQDCPEQAHVIGGIIAAPPRLPFIKLCIQQIITHLLSGSLNTKGWSATGPGVVNMILKDYNTRRIIRKWSFKEMQQGFLFYRRVPGVTNTWVQQQQQGIIDPALYANGPLDLTALPTES